MSEGFADYVDVTDVKQYFFCPRIVYFNRVLGIFERVTESQQLGREEHEELSKKERRRKTLAKLRSLESSQKWFKIFLWSDKLKLCDRVDCVAKVGREYVPIEYKRARLSPGRVRRSKVPQNHFYQLVAYALLVEERFGCVVRRGFIYYAESDLLIEVPITDDAKRYVESVVRRIHEMTANEMFPSRTADPKVCRSCGYRWVCVDQRSE